MRGPGSGRPPAGHHLPDPEEDDCAQRRDDDRIEIHARCTGSSEGGEQTPSNEGADHAEEQRGEEPPALLAGRDDLGEPPGNEANDDPSEKTHASPPLLCQMMMVRVWSPAHHRLTE